MSAELMKLLTAAHDKVSKTLAAKLAEADECRQDLADLEEHIERQRAKDRKQAAAEPPTEVWPPVPPRDPQHNGAAALGQSAPAVFPEQAVYVDRAGGQWNLQALFADNYGGGWKWAGTVAPSGLGDGEVPVLMRISGDGYAGEEQRFDSLVERVGLRVNDDGPAPTDTITDPPVPNEVSEK